jgi:repressor LexA
MIRFLGYYVCMHLLQEKLLEQAEKNPKIGILSLRDMGRLVGERSPQKIKHHLAQLEKNGLIKIDRKNRIIEKVKEGKLKESSTLIAIPVLGFANCGQASILAEQQPEGFLKVSSRLLTKTKKIFALQAIGNSLNKAQIGKQKKSLEEGDFAIIDYEDITPKNGDYVLSIIEGMANLKRFKYDKENEQVILYSESTQSHRPIFIHPSDDYLIGGKVIGVLKNSTK